MIRALATTTAPQLYGMVHLDTPGTLVASAKSVGPCGETWAAMAGLNSHKTWFKQGAAGTRVEAWPYDAGDLLGVLRRPVHASVADGDQWGNPKGLRVAIAHANQVYGTAHVLRNVSGSKQCGLFPAPVGGGSTAPPAVATPAPTLPQTPSTKASNASNATNATIVTLVPATASIRAVISFGWVFFMIS